MVLHFGTRPTWVALPAGKPRPNRPHNAPRTPIGPVGRRKGAPDCPRKVWERNPSSARHGRKEKKGLRKKGGRRKEPNEVVRGGSPRPEEGRTEGAEDVEPTIRGLWGKGSLSSSGDGTSPRKAIGPLVISAPQLRHVSRATRPRVKRHVAAFASSLRAPGRTPRWRADVRTADVVASRKQVPLRGKGGRKLASIDGRRTPPVGLFFSRTARRRASWDGSDALVRDRTNGNVS